MNARRFLLPCGFLLGLLCAGCHQGRSYVYVNLDAAVLPSSPSPASPSHKSVPALPATSAKFTIPASAAIIEGRTTGAGTAKVQATIAASRERTYKLIVRRLHDNYAREAANLRSRQLASFTPIRAAIVAQAMNAVSLAYVKYADAVGPKYARLAVTAGFRDPDPKGRRKPNGLEGLDTLAYQTSQKLRADIAALASDFDRYRETTLRSADADADAKLTELLSDVARQVAAMDAEAQDVARREVNKAQAQLGPLLADRPPTPLPATPERSVVVGSGAQVGVATTYGDRPESWAGDDRARAKADLGVWLAVNRYVARAKGQGRDATAEFIEWRHRFRQEPSASP